MALQKCRHLSLVLFRGKGAGGIDHLAAGGQAGRCVIQDLCPQCGALLYQRFTMLGHRHGFLAEHSLAGAGRIHENTVKKLRQSGGNAASVLVQHHGVGHAHPLQIAPEHLGAGGNELVAHQQSLPAQRRRHGRSGQQGAKTGLFGRETLQRITEAARQQGICPAEEHQREACPAGPQRKAGTPQHQRPAPGQKCRTKPAGPEPSGGHGRPHGAEQAEAVQ